MPYVASTQSAPVEYVDWIAGPSGGAHVRGMSVTVNGGANVAQRESGGIFTRQGVLTKVTDDELAFLQRNEVFKDHLKAGHVKIMRSESKPEKFTGDMKKRDASAPLTVSDYEPGGRGAGVPAPNVGIPH